MKAAKTQRVFIQNGINAISDLALTDGREVAFVSNMDLRGEKAAPVKGPRLLSEIMFGENYPVQIFRYRGRQILSSKRRSYVASYMEGRERIYWTEDRGEPRKMIEGIDLPIGVNRPRYAPVVLKGTSVSPIGVTLAEIEGGSLHKDTGASFRLAYRTVQGVLPASGSVAIKVGSDGRRVRVRWSNPVMEPRPLETLVFYSPTSGTERLVGAVAYGTSEYLLDAAISGQEFATVYDQESEFSYVSTFVQIVEGIEHESGPSSPSVRLKSSSGRLVIFNPWGDGFLDSPNRIGIEDYASSYTFVKFAGYVGSGVANAVDISGIVDDADAGYVRMDFASAIAPFMDGERLLVAGLTPDPFAGMPVEIVRIDGSDTSVYLRTGEGIVAPGAGLSGVTAYRVPECVIESFVYNHNSTMVEFNTVEPHTFGLGQKVYFSGFEDLSWNAFEFPVIPDDTNPKRFYVDGMSVPIDATAGQTVRQSYTVMPISVSPDIMPKANTTVYIENGTVNAAYRVAGVIPGGVVLGSYIASAADVEPAPGDWFTSGLKWIPDDDYIRFRRLYRVGGTGRFRLVKELRLDEAEFMDNLPDDALGGILPSWYQDRGVDVIYEPAPTGLRGLTQHYGMGFAWDPITNRLRWTPRGVIDAWPENFYRDFPSSIQAIVSFDQALIVLCEDRPYRMDGTDPVNLVRTAARTSAGCKAGGSVQIVRNRLVYLSDSGLMLFDGQDAECVTDGRIRPEFWRGLSAYVNSMQIPNSFLVPAHYDASFFRLRGHMAIAPASLTPFQDFSSVLPGIKSFTRHGKYYMYWSADTPDHAAQTMLSVDFGRKEMPISVIGLKVVDVFVDELERMWAIISRSGCIYSGGEGGE